MLLFLGSGRVVDKVALGPRGHGFDSCNHRYNINFSRNLQLYFVQDHQF